MSTNHRADQRPTASVVGAREPTESFAVLRAIAEIVSGSPLYFWPQHVKALAALLAAHDRLLVERDAAEAATVPIRVAPVVREPVAQSASAGWPRRGDALRWTPAEHAIQQAVDAVEVMGADVRLTDAIILLGKARARVADFVDNVEPPKSEAKAEALREDAERLDWLERDALKEPVLLHELTGKMTTRGLGFSLAIGRSLREAIDAARASRAVVPTEEGQ